MESLPVKFESIIRLDTLKFGPLILKVDEDLARFRKLAAFTSAQSAGMLSIVKGPPGQGKTTAIYAASVLLRNDFATVLSVPAVIDLRSIARWVVDNIPAVVGDRLIPVLIDGRESTDDTQGLRDLMSALNNLVRGRPDLLFIWPTTSLPWQRELVSAARQVGSTSFCPDEAVFDIAGPAKAQWTEAVNLVLAQLDLTWDEFGINEASATELAKDYSTLGDFLTAINRVRVEQQSFADNATGLPELVFVVTSHSQVVNDVARLRNPKTYRLRTDELIGSAPQSGSGKFWTERGKSQSTNLAWVSGLLQAKLVSLTPSTVAHACGIHVPPTGRIADALKPLPFRPSRSSGRTAFKTTDLSRFMHGQPVPQVASSVKGRTSAKTLGAYDAIQALSSRKHKEINTAILQFIGTDVGLFDPAEVAYEQDLGGDAIADAVAPIGDRRVHLEFHHLSGDACSPNKIADYVMKKVRTYAVQFNLIAR